MIDFSSDNPSVFVLSSLLFSIMVFFYLCNFRPDVTVRELTDGLVTNWQLALYNYACDAFLSYC